MSSLRNTILNYIKEAEDYFNCLNPEIMKNLLDRITYIEINLNLDSVLLAGWNPKEDDTITNRQVHCLNHCMNLISIGEPAKAYHELYDFIHDMGRKDKIPLHENEIKGIKLIVDAMKRELSLY